MTSAVQQIHIIYKLILSFIHLITAIICLYILHKFNTTATGNRSKVVSVFFNCKKTKTKKNIFPNFKYGKMFLFEKVIRLEIWTFWYISKKICKQKMDKKIFLCIDFKSNIIITGWKHCHFYNFCWNSLRYFTTFSKFYCCKSSKYQSECVSRIISSNCNLLWRIFMFMEIFVIFTSII